MPSRGEQSMRLTNARWPSGKPESSPEIPGHSDAVISFEFFGVGFAATVWHGLGVCAVRTRVYSDRRSILSHTEFAGDGCKGFVPDP